MRRFYRSAKHKILGGVCGGFAEYFKIDPVFIRLVWILFTLLYGAGAFLYLLAWILMERNPRHKW